MIYKNISPNIYRLHKDDRKEIVDIVGKYQARIKNTPCELNTLQRLTEHYLGGKYIYSRTFTLMRMWNHLLFILDKRGGENS